MAVFVVCKLRVVFVILKACKNNQRLIRGPRSLKHLLSGLSRKELPVPAPNTNTARQSLGSSPSVPRDINQVSVRLNLEPSLNNYIKNVNQYFQEMMHVSQNVTKVHFVQQMHVKVSMLGDKVEGVFRNTVPSRAGWERGVLS